MCRPTTTSPLRVKYVIGISRAKWLLKRRYTFCGLAFASAKGADEALQKKMEEWKKSRRAQNIKDQGPRTRRSPLNRLLS